MSRRAAVLVAAVDALGGDEFLAGVAQVLQGAADARIGLEPLVAVGVAIQAADVIALDAEGEPDRLDGVIDGDQRLVVAHRS